MIKYLPLLTFCVLTLSGCETFHAGANIHAQDPKNIYHSTRDASFDPVMTLYIFPSEKSDLAGDIPPTGRTIQFPLFDENLYQLNK